MRKFFKVLLGAWITGAVLGGGCVCGSLATGLIFRRDHSPDYEFVQAQIVEIQEAMNNLAAPMPEGWDEMAGLE